ncbi:MAG: archaemetzincin family Zn-dependent metalloprotease [Candidatus Zixiibacteriota bacterium]
MKSDETICLTAVGEVDKDMLIFLQTELQKVFKKEVKTAMALENPDYAYNPERDQYHSSKILERMKKEKFKDCNRVLGVADVDLYVPSLNFVFGEADFYDRVAVISLVRLRQEYYALPEDDKLFQERVLKEAVHELGHTYRLRHCPDINCVMHFSNSLKDTDIKSPNFCPQCKSKLDQK